MRTSPVAGNMVEFCGWEFVPDGRGAEWDQTFIAKWKGECTM
jgi:hypothetical protein